MAELQQMPVAELTCPGCDEIGAIDRDQYEGRVSVHHYPGCGYHATIDWSAVDSPRVRLL